MHMGSRQGRARPANEEDGPVAPHPQGEPPSPWRHSSGSSAEDEAPELRLSPQPAQMLWAGSPSAGRRLGPHMEDSPGHERPMSHQSPEPASMSSRAPVIRAPGVQVPEDMTLHERPTPRSSPAPPSMLYRGDPEGELPEVQSSPTHGSFLRPRRATLVVAPPQTPALFRRNSQDSPRRPVRPRSSSMGAAQPPPPLQPVGDLLENLELTSPVAASRPTERHGLLEGGRMIGEAVDPEAFVVMQDTPASSQMEGSGREHEEARHIAQRLFTEAPVSSMPVSPPSTPSTLAGGRPIRPRGWPPEPLQLVSPRSWPPDSLQPVSRSHSKQSSDDPMQDQEFYERPSQAPSLVASPMHYRVKEEI